MKFLPILLLVLPLSLAAPGGSSSNAEDPLQRAIRVYGEAVNLVLTTIQNNQPINRVLWPLSFLGSGNTGFVFKGVRFENDEQTAVAIKFVNKDGAAQAKKEYAMYTYLDAIDKAEAEEYGIPTVYYYGRWKGLIVTAYTELGTTLANLQRSVRYQNYDILILIQQFIKQSKYMHSHGIRHDDITPQNILIRGCDSFLIDFDLASKMSEDNRGTTDYYSSLNYHQGLKRVATDDWESFLYVICEMAGIPFEWFVRDLSNMQENELLQVFADSKSQRLRMLEIIQQSGHRSLKPIIRAFALEAFSGRPIPNYDSIDSLVNAAFKKYYPTVTCFSWMNGIRDELIVNNIGHLAIPNDFNEYVNFTYPVVNEKFFKKG